MALIQRSYVFLMIENLRKNILGYFLSTVDF
jgi:hypothetical protein